MGSLVDPDLSSAMSSLPGIPIVDLSEILGKYGSPVISNDAYERVMKKLGDAMSGIGFAYLINHGIDFEKIEDIHKESRKFFLLPESIKMKYHKKHPAENFSGYTKPGDEFLNEQQHNSTELREIFDIWGLWEEDKLPYPTEEVPSLKVAYDTVRPDLDNLCKKLFLCMAKYINLEEDFFIQRHKNLGDTTIPTQTQMRSMYYYELNSNKGDADYIPPNAIRCGEHADWGSITLLFQDDVGGLEVRNIHGEWLQATPIKDAIILNSGQLMEFWSGGHFHAAFHRVRVPDVIRTDVEERPRQSFIYFVNPDGDEEVFSVVEPKKGKEHLKTRKPEVAFQFYKDRIVEATKKGGILNS